MNLEERILSNFYPKTCPKTKKLTFTKNHGVKSLGFRKIGPKHRPIFAYVIDSPSVEHYKERLYELNYTRNGRNDTERIIHQTFSGLIGESLMRITLKEIFRRLEEKMPFKNTGFIKTDLNPYENKRVIRENEEYILQGISRYNQIIMDKQMMKTHPDFATTTEYDGLFEYELGNQKGLIICESKIGDIGYLKTSDNSKEEIYHKIIKPIQSLYPEKQVDFLLMSTKKELTEQEKYKPLQTKITRLNDYLNKHNIGLIPMIMPETNDSINRAAKSILHLSRLEKLNNEAIPATNKYIIDKNMLIIITGKRIDFMLERTTKNNFSTVYDSGELDNLFNIPFYEILNEPNPYRTKRIQIENN